MAAGGRCFVEWKEKYVSKERGNRVVHYFLKDNSGESILAVVGTERSVRHMFYVVSDEFLSSSGADNSVHAGFRWRSRREVVNWLTSMLSKQQRREDHSLLPKYGLVPEANARLMQMLPYKDRSARNFNGHSISWSGSAWVCNKQLTHYPAFHRNGTSISVQSFVFVMAEKENHYIAYLEDMYEDRKFQKKVKVRWFHYNREVKGVVSLRNPHPKEVFITPYIQVISAECIDGRTTVLSREHYEKFLSIFPHNLLSGVHFCFRQFKSNRVKPFKLSRLQGYFDQPIFSCFSSDFFEEDDFSSEEDVHVGSKRARDNHKFNFPYKKQSEEPDFFKNDDFPVYAVNDKVEFLCQDSGMRGCWFRSTVLEVSSRKMKIRYDDIRDEDLYKHLEEWIPTNRVAKSDKLKMRRTGRPTVRPFPPCGEITPTLDVGSPVDAWWSDGWWEGVVSSELHADNGAYQIYIPGEKLYLIVEPKNIRVSRDWSGDGWVDVAPNPDFLSALSTKDNDTIALKDTKSTIGEMEIDGLADMALTNVPLEEERSNAEQHRAFQDGGETAAQSPSLSNEAHEEEEEEENDESNLVECEISELRSDDEMMMEMLNCF